MFLSPGKARAGVLFLVALRLFEFGSAASGAALHVCPDGDDANPGTKERPFATLERARDALRERGDGEPGLVELRGGRHFRDRGFVLRGEDSGQSGQNVIFRVAPGEVAVLDGGHMLEPERFQAVEDAAVRKRMLPSVRNRVLQLDLGALGIEDFGHFGPRGWGRPGLAPPMELIVDGVPQEVARWPNEGSIPLGVVVDDGGRPRDDGGMGRDAVFHHNTERAPRWTEAEDMYISGLFGVTWAHDTMRVRRINMNDGTFVTDGPHHYGFRQPGSPGNFETHYHVVNLLEEIERPGEYYIDRSSGVLYFLPPYPLGNSLIQLTSLEEPMIALRGASHVTIEGMILENARGTGIRIEGGESIRIVGCTIRALGGMGVVVQGGKGHHVVSCDIHHVGGGGMVVQGGERRTLEPGGHLVRNCDIHAYNRWIRHYNPGIRLGGVGNTIEHNHLHHSAHQAITFSGNDHRIAHNEIHRVLLDISDMGAIYVGRNPTYAGHVIESNFFHHIQAPHNRGPGVQALFFDDDTVFAARVTGNVFYRAGSSGVIKFHGGGGGSIGNNIAIACPPLVQYSPGQLQGMARALSKMRTDEPFGHGFPEMMEDVGFFDPPFLVRYPYQVDFYREKFHPYLLDAEDPESKPRVPHWNNFETEDELHHFVNPAALDFRLRGDSPLLRQVAGNVYDRVAGYEHEDIPFREIPFAAIGLLADDHRPVPGPRPFSKLGPEDGQAAAVDGEVALRWSSSAGADTYRVTVAADPDLRQVVHQKRVQTNHMSIDGLQSGRDYYWQVEAGITRSKSNRGVRLAEERPWRFRLLSHVP